MSPGKRGQMIGEGCVRALVLYQVGVCVSLCVSDQKQRREAGAF